MKKPQTHLNRNVALDFLRTIAILLVIARHMLVCPESVSPILHTFTKHLAMGGWIGVDLFFVLSGFLVSGILFREEQTHGRIDLKRFFIRRGFKIYPAFWLFLLFTLFVKSADDLNAVLGEILFLQNYLGALWIHTWSLAVEEHFYILLGFLLLFLAKRKSSKKTFSSIPLLFIGIALICLLLRVEVMLSKPFDYSTHMFPSHLRIDSLMFGVLLSWLWHYGKLAETMSNRRTQIIYCIIGGLLLLPAFFYTLRSTMWIPVLGVQLFYLGSGSLMLGLLQSKTMEHKGVLQLAHIGVYSYSIYLWHQPVNEWVQAALKIDQGVTYNWYLYVGIYVLGSLLIGYLAAKLVEYPIIKLRDRLFPSRSSGFHVAVSQEKAESAMI